MREVKRFKCDYCNRVTAKEETIKRHETQCIHNPNSVNCFRCEFAYEGDYHMDEYRTMDNAPICAYTEEFITENFALKCDTYKRSGEMYYQRNCEETAANLKAEMEKEEE